ncbi:MAG: hypothetical protein JST89_18020 [Cyanobacteria bacterium SZAS-4]|nr:hypothetical protein [Cyanobacteria bacterium SZAS-4]
MNRYIGIALMATALSVHTQLAGCAQTSEQSQPVTSQLQPAMPATVDTNLRGPIGSQPAVQSPATLPFTSSSPYSYSEPSDTVSNNAEVQPVVTSPLPVASPSPVPSSSKVAPAQSKNMKTKHHGFSPFGAVFGIQDRAFKSSLGLTDRTAKAGLGVTGKTTKEVFKAVF